MVRRCAAAHQHAAEYWQWRVRVWPQDRADDVEDLLEARHHLFGSRPTRPGWRPHRERQCDQLHAWGAWDREEALIHDTLARLPADSARRAAWISQLGDIAMGRTIADATTAYRQALALNEELVRRDPSKTGFQRDLSVSYNRWGIWLRMAGQTAEATRCTGRP